jgi:hypothetical protein
MFLFGPLFFKEVLRIQIHYLDGTGKAIDNILLFFWRGMYGSIKSKGSFNLCGDFELMGYIY